VTGDLHAGRRPQEETDGLTVYQLTVKFLAAKKAKRDNGELSPRTFVEYGQLCNRLAKVLGKNRLVSDLRPDDFAKLRANMAAKWGPVRLRSQIVLARGVFNFAERQQLIGKPVVYGDSFNVPSEKVIRVHRSKGGEKMFEAEEIRCMLDAASQPLRAMILLAINAGYGNNDVATLPLSAIDLAGGWISHSRPKTGIARKCPLWVETVEAIRDWLTVRPEPEDVTAHGSLLFITYKRGSWLDNGDNRALSHEFRKLLDRLDIHGHRGFYALRHSFQTIGDESGDFIAVRKIMGHIRRGDIADVYRERVSDDRFRRVTDSIRSWLFDQKAATPEPRRDAGGPELRIVG
jgi:integrase